MDYRHIVTVEPGRMGGRPCIRGMRIAVIDILEYLAGGSSIEELLSEFDEPTHEDVLAALACAADRERRELLAA